MAGLCFGKRMKHLDDSRASVDLGNLTEEDLKKLKKKQLQEILASFGLPKSGNVRDLQSRVLSLQRKEAVKDQYEEQDEELSAQGGKRLQVSQSSVSGSGKKKKWRVTDPAQIAPHFYHRDLFIANFPLVEVVDVPGRIRFPVPDKFDGITLDYLETVQARRRWFKVFLKAEHAYADAETERQAFPKHFAFLDAVWQFTKPSSEDVDDHRECSRGLKRKSAFDDMLAETKRMKPDTEENSGFYINPETEDIEEPFGAKRSDGDNEGLSIVPEEVAEMYGDLQEHVDAATGFADGVLHVHDDRPQKKGANTGSSSIFNPDRVVGILEWKFAEDKHKWNARFQGGFYAVKHTMVNISRGHGRPVYVLVKTSSSWSYGILVPEGFVQIRGGLIDRNSMHEFQRHQELTGNKQNGLQELQVKLQKGTAFYRKNFLDNPQANYVDGPMLVGTFYLNSRWFALPKAQYANGQAEGPRRLFDGLMRLILGDCAIDMKDEDFNQRWQLREQMLEDETQAWVG